MFDFVTNSLYAIYTTLSRLQHTTRIRNTATTKMSGQPPDLQEKRRAITLAAERVYAAVNRIDSLLEDAETAEPAKSDCINASMEVMEAIEGLKALVVPKFYNNPLFLDLMLAQKAATAAIAEFTKGSGTLQDIRDKVAVYCDATRDFE